MFMCTQHTHAEVHLFPTLLTHCTRLVTIHRVHKTSLLRSLMHVTQVLDMETEWGIHTVYLM